MENYNLSMDEEFISIKNSSISENKINELKKHTGKKFNQPDSHAFQLHNFDFTKKFFFIPKKF